MASQIYWTVMMVNSVHVIRERSPNILDVVGSMKSRIAPIV
jgi:hypothetical protein